MKKQSKILYRILTFSLLFVLGGVVWIQAPVQPVAAQEPTACRIAGLVRRVVKRRLVCALDERACDTVESQVSDDDATSCDPVLVYCGDDGFIAHRWAVTHCPLLSFDGYLPSHLSTAAWLLIRGAGGTPLCDGPSWGDVHMLSHFLLMVACLSTLR